MNADHPSLPDIAGQTTNPSHPEHLGYALNWVGMRHLKMPMLWPQADEKTAISLMADVDALVNLAPNTSRGIHMSRIYRLLDEQLSAQDITFAHIEQMLHAMIDSQEDLATQAKLVIRTEVPLRRSALLSPLSGWRAYPWRLESSLSTEQGSDAQVRHQLTTEVLYSSTCPNSAALAHDANMSAIKQQMQDLGKSAEQIIAELHQASGQAATPHAQRSKATIKLAIQPSQTKQGMRSLFQTLVDATEQTLATPVQTAVKRQDEQAFAQRNAANTMFCEDAARRIGTLLDGWAWVSGYHATFEHFESLHAHDAYAEIARLGR